MTKTQTTDRESYGIGTMWGDDWVYVAATSWGDASSPIMGDAPGQVGDYRHSKVAALRAALQAMATAGGDDPYEDDATVQAVEDALDEAVDVDMDGHRVTR